MLPFVWLGFSKYRFHSLFVNIPEADIRLHCSVFNYEVMASIMKGLVLALIQAEKE